MAYTDQELAIINRVYDEFAPRRSSITSARDANPSQWFDYQNQLKALDAEVKSAYEKAIADYRSGASTQEDSGAQNFLDDYVSALPGGEQGPAQGPNTPVRRDGDLFVPKDFAPPPYRAVPLAKGPRGETLGKDYGELAQLSNIPGPSGFDRRPGSYDPRNIIPIKSPGSSHSGNGGFDMIDPFKDSPVTKPGLSEGPDLDEQQTRIASSEYDPQKAKAAAGAAKAYKTGNATEDPFRSQAVFG